MKYSTRCLRVFDFTKSYEYQVLMFLTEIKINLHQIGFNNHQL